MLENVVFGLMEGVLIGRPVRKQNTVLSGSINTAVLISQDFINITLEDRTLREKGSFFLRFIEYVSIRHLNKKDLQKAYRN